MKAIRIIKRFSIIFLLVIVIFVSSITFSYNRAKAAVPLVAGAALIVAALSSYMAASGVNIASNANSDGSDVVAMWEDICAEYQADGKTLQSWYGEAGQAVNILVGKENAQKFAIASTSLCNWFDGLREWLTNRYDMNSTAPVTISGSRYFVDGDGRQIPFIENSSYSISYSQYIDCPSIMAINNNTLVGSSFLFNVGGYYYRYTVTRNNPTFMSSYGQIVFSRELVNTGSTSSIPTTYYFGNQGTAKLLFVYTGSKLYLHVYSLSNNSSNVERGSVMLSLDVTNLHTENISVTGVLSDGYQDYQDAMDQALTDAGANGKIGIDIGDWDYTGANTKEAIAEGYLNRIATTGTAEGTLTGGYTDEKEAEEDTDADFVPSAAWYDKNLIVVDGLEDFFPFCIPFDLIELVRKFDVEPEAPVIHWNMSFANLYEDQELVLDFSPWETAALIFRICCLIGFSIFLILKTRDMIRG